MVYDLTGAIDCDLHPKVPTPGDLLPYFDAHWRETVVLRGIDSWETIGYPANSPFTIRQDWRESQPRADAAPQALARALLDPHKFAAGILNPLFPVAAFRDPMLAAVFARAVNDWTADVWLAQDQRLKAALLVPVQSVDLAVEEIERRAKDMRFVQVLMWVMGEQTLGRRQFWPIYAAAEKHGFAVALHAGSSYFQAVTGSGWPSTWIEDYAAQAQGFHTQVGSLISEGVFVKFPKLKVILAESGVTWLPGYLWRLGKFWRGGRSEVPWLDRPPLDYARDHIRLTLQPFDAPSGSEAGASMLRLMGQLPSQDMLLFSTDFPHWQFDGDEMLPEGLPDDVVRKIIIENPRTTLVRETLHEPRCHLARPGRHLVGSSNRP